MLYWLLICFINLLLKLALNNNQTINGLLIYSMLKKTYVKKYQLKFDQHLSEYFFHVRFFFVEIWDKIIAIILLFHPSFFSYTELIESFTMNIKYVMSSFCIKRKI
jgi:hypothetical protein